MTDDKEIKEFKQPHQESAGSGNNDNGHSFAEQLPNLPLDFLNIYGLIETVTAVPTGKPTKLFDQIKFYTDSLSAPTVWRLYVYFTAINAWHYTSLT